MAWEANMDMQPVFNHCKAVAYMCAYLSNSESKCSVAMKQSVQDTFERERDNYEQMKSAANAYISKREHSIQECVHYILPGQWLKKTFPGVIFANSNVQEKLFRLCLNEDEIFELPEDSNKIFKRNAAYRYIDRPHTTSSDGKFAVLDTLSFAEFSRYYYLPSNPKYKENDYHPELDDESISGMSNIGYTYPKKIKLLSNGKLKCRKIPYVLQYYVPNKETSPEEYAHHMLFMYYPFRNEKELLSRNPPTYVSKLSKNGVIEVVNQNYSLAEPFATIVDDAFLRINYDNVTNMDPYGHQEKDEVTDKIVDFSDNSDIDTLETTKSQSADLGNTNAFTNLLRVVPGDNVINKNIRSLNMQQREIFNFVHK